MARNEFGPVGGIGWKEREKKEEKVKTVHLSPAVRKALEKQMIEGGASPLEVQRLMGTVTS